MVRSIIAAIKEETRLRVEAGSGLALSGLPRIAPQEIGTFTQLLPEHLQQVGFRPTPQAKKRASPYSHYGHKVPRTHGLDPVTIGLTQSYGRTRSVIQPPPFFLGRFVAR